ncbi:hypothetical protein ES702_00575 [subsurface metagenome]
MKERFVAEIDEKGRILVPVYFRDRLGLKAGDKVNVELDTEKDVPKV